MESSGTIKGILLFLEQTFFSYMTKRVSRGIDLESSCGMSEAKVGDACLYCPGCHLKSFRIGEEEWIVKCESETCLYPIAITNEQCFRCREQVIETDTLDNFLEEIFTDSTTPEPPEPMTFEETSTEAQFIDLPIDPASFTEQKSESILDSTSASVQEPSHFFVFESSPAPTQDPSQVNILGQVQIPLDSFENAFQGTFGVTTHPQIIEPLPDHNSTASFSQIVEQSTDYKFTTSVFQVAEPDYKCTTSSQLQVEEPTQEITIPPVQTVKSSEPKQKITSSMKHLELTKTLSTSSNSSGTTPKFKTGQIIRRIIKREPSGTEEPREVVQRVTHMKPLDYVKYFMEQNRMS